MRAIYHINVGQMISCLDKLLARWQGSLEKCLRIWPKIAALLIQANSGIALLGNSGQRGATLLKDALQGTLCSWDTGQRFPSDAVYLEQKLQKKSWLKWVIRNAYLHLISACKGLQNVVSWKNCQCACVSLAFLCSLLFFLPFPLLLFPSFSCLNTFWKQYYNAPCFKITVYFTRYDLIRALIMFSAA